MDMGNGMTPADMAAVVGNRGGFGGGYGGYGGYDIMWIILFMFCTMNGGWGNNGWGRGNVGYDIGADMQRGFNQQATQGAIAALQAQVGNGFADAAVAQCQGNANITAAITNGQYATAQAITGAKDTINGTLQSNQIATYQGLNQLAMNLQNCCCENRAGLADLKYTVATEACADRQAVSDGLRDIIANNTANTNALAQAINNGIQSIKDDLCQDRLDAANRQIAQLQTQLNMANLAASQTAQTAQLIQDNNMQTANLIRAINPNTSCCCGNNGYYGCAA
jgi:hypothetical protein